jgi:WD repeat and SOF domain-containing protein 1
MHRWKPFDPSRNWPDLGPRFLEGETLKRPAIDAGDVPGRQGAITEVGPDQRDLDWSTVLKRVLESYIRAERPNMYGEMLQWSDP